MQQLPIRLQFSPVNLGPRLNEPKLRLGKTAPQALDRIHREHRRLILIVRVEVRSVMLPPASTNIRMTIPKKRESSGTFEL